MDTHNTPTTAVNSKLERDLIDVIEDLEVALDYSRGRFVRPRIETAID